MFKSLLPRETAVTVGLAQAAAVYAIYGVSLPSVTDVRSNMPHDQDVEATRKGAAMKSAGVLGVVFLLTKDLNSFIIGGVALIGIDYMYKHNNAVHPATQKIDATSDGTSIAPGLATAYPMPDYSDETVA
jgi:hypothetical protein